LGALKHVNNVAGITVGMLSYIVSLTGSVAAESGGLLHVAARFASRLLARVARWDLFTVSVVRFDLSLDQGIAKILWSLVGYDREFWNSIVKTWMTLNDRPVLSDDFAEVRELRVVCHNQWHSVRCGVTSAGLEGVLARH